jgi:hypothetical protein
LKEFLRDGIDEEIIISGKRKGFKIMMDKEINKDQYKNIEGIELEEEYRCK